MTAKLLTKKLGKHIGKVNRIPGLSYIVKPALVYGSFVFWLLIAFLLSRVWISETPILLIGLEASLFVFIFLMVKQVTQNYTLAIIATALGVIPWLSHQLGQLNALVTNINRFAIEVGRIKVTPITLAKALILVVILGWASSLVVDWANVYIKKKLKLKASTKALLSKGVELGVYLLTFVMVLSLLGIDLTALTVVGGALGVGIGFGLQKITSNFISGIILLLEKSIEVDDLIEMEGGIYGFIRKIGARNAIIEMFDGKEVMVPNEDFMTHRVTNWTYSNAQGRIEINVGVSYKSDIKKVQELILEAAMEHPLCSKFPIPECFLREFGDSSVNFLLFFFIDDVSAGRFKPQSEVMMTIWDKFKENDIEIPFPQRDIHIKTSVDKPS